MPYKIIRFRKNGNSKVIGKHYSLEQAQSHCQREDTQKLDKEGNVIWFDGYTEE